MKRIVKNVEPRSFTDWKQTQADNWEPSWGNFQNPQKTTVKISLLAEQGNICCYCEQSLSDTTTEFKSHIEHIRPRSTGQYNCEELVYENLLCSCGPRHNKGTPSHCGDRKGDWYDDDLFISPLDPTCENRFSYTAYGEIIPRDENDNAARTTIDRLGLNIQHLITLRRARLNVFLDSNVDAGQQRKFLAIYLLRNSDENFNAFWTTAHYFLENSFS